MFSKRPAPTKISRPVTSAALSVLQTRFETYRQRFAAEVAPYLLTAEQQQQIFTVVLLEYSVRKAERRQAKSLRQDKWNLDVCMQRLQADLSAFKKEMHLKERVQAFAQEQSKAYPVLQEPGCPSLLLGLAQQIRLHYAGFLTRPHPDVEAEYLQASGEFAAAFELYQDSLKWKESFKQSYEEDLSSRFPKYVQPLLFYIEELSHCYWKLKLVDLGLSVDDAKLRENLQKAEQKYAAKKLALFKAETEQRLEHLKARRFIPGITYPSFSEKVGLEKKEVRHPNKARFGGGFLVGKRNSLPALPGTAKARTDLKNKQH